jgi:hypothetical protein
VRNGAETLGAFNADAMRVVGTAGMTVTAVTPGVGAYLGLGAFGATSRSQAPDSPFSDGTSGISSGASTPGYTSGYTPGYTPEYGCSGGGYSSSDEPGSVGAGAGAGTSGSGSGGEWQEATETNSFLSAIFDGMEGPTDQSIFV